MREKGKVRGLYALRIEILKQISFNGTWVTDLVAQVNCGATGTTVSSEVFTLKGTDITKLPNHLRDTTALETLILDTNKTQADPATMTIKYFQDDTTQRHYVDLLVVDSMLAMGQKILARLKPTLDNSPATGVQAPPPSTTSSGATSPANGASQSGAAS